MTKKNALHYVMKFRNVDFILFMKTILVVYTTLVTIHIWLSQLRIPFTKKSLKVIENLVNVDVNYV